MGEIALELTRIYIESKKNSTSTKEEILDTYYYFKDNLIIKPLLKNQEPNIQGSRIVDLSKIEPIKTYQK